MKNPIFAALVLSVALAVTAAAQVNPAISAANSPVAKSLATKPEAAPDSAKATRARVLTVGRLIADKGMDVLIEACAAAGLPLATSSTCVVMALIDSTISPIEVS